jgi:peptidoglycan biosynthesis protein MviN/MurJ (putative lipid II flippase)
MEAWIARLLANDYFASIAGAFAANILVQTTFPYLTLIFFLQLCVAILFVAGLQRIQLGTPKNN